MAVKLSPQDVARLGPGAQSQIRAVQPEERPDSPLFRKTPRRTSSRRRTGALRPVARLGRSTGRSARSVKSNLSPGSIFGMITGAAVIGALVFRANTVSALLGHMTSYWQKVIGLGKAAK